MYKALTKYQREWRQDFTWKQDWSSTEKSVNSPTQGNEYDCGIFTLISTSLLRNGHRLRRNSYVQESLYHRNLRKKLVWTIWKAGLGNNVVHWQQETQRHIAEATGTGGATRTQLKGSHQKKKRRKEGLLIPGGDKMQSLIEWYGNDQANKDKGRGQKRNAKSVAEEEGGKGIATCIKQPLRKRGNSVNPAFKLG